MCGRTAIYKTPKQLGRVFDADIEQTKWEGSYNVAPGTETPIVTRNSPRNLSDAFWGFIPEWADDIEEWMQKSVINARSETAAGKSLFEDAVESNRCLVPSNGFYEWKGSRGSKTPFYIHVKDRETFAFAGIYSEYSDGSYSYAVLTQDPNEKVAGLHDRMPVILSKEMESQWLNFELSPQNFPRINSEKLEVYPVTSHVNNPEFDNERCVKKKSTLSDF
ncbi:MAG: SOS response-associated peptidase [Candidatus Nanohaloarchaea archaeon]